MIGEIDAVIIARDDWKSHINWPNRFWSWVSQFLLISLSLDQTELEYFSQYLDEGKLMSCSGFRFAKELDKITNLGAVKYPRNSGSRLGKIRCPYFRCSTSYG